MPSSQVHVQPSGTPRPVPKPFPEFDGSPTIDETASVLGVSSLTAIAGQPAGLANVNQSNVTANTNRGTQNAVANQQAHAQLALSVLGKTVNKVSNLAPLASRTSVDVLTDNATADEIASLKAAIEAFGGSGGRRGRFTGRELRRLVAKLIAIIEGNARVTGSGTVSDPYAAVVGPIYFKAPTTIAFVSTAPRSTLNFEVEGNGGLQVG